MRELRASRSTEKQGRMELTCIFFSPRKPHRVLEAVLALSLQEKFSTCFFEPTKLVSVVTLQDIKDDFKLNKYTSFYRASVQL